MSFLKQTHYSSLLSLRNFLFETGLSPFLTGLTGRKLLVQLSDLQMMNHHYIHFFCFEMNMKL